jgi:predicted NAD/FAD-dependent oxidoreductase
MVISTAPPAQTLRLFEGHLAADAPLAKASLLGCYTLMLGFKRPWEKQWIAAKVHDNPLDWIAVNSTKPERNPHVTCIVAHTRNDWAEEHIDDDITEVQAFLLQQFESVTGIDFSKTDFDACHRWRYAIVETAEESEFYHDSNQGLAATGDWVTASRIEDAWLSAVNLAKDIIRKAIS